MPDDQPLQRYAVTVIRHALEEAIIYLSAGSIDEAEIEADKIVDEGLITEFAVNEVQYDYYVDEIDPNHEVEPTNGSVPGGPICGVCEQPVEWTGASADDPGNATGRLIPGPWRHKGEELVSGPSET
jgi:hypothetical protein